VADRLQAEYPRARVVRDRLYVLDGNIVTSAGVASGIDMALALVEADAGASVAARVAREMVVYVRRSGSTGQLSVFLLHRDHLHPGVHRVQDWLAAHPERRATLDDLARVAAMSARNLTRVFRRETGVSLKEYATSVKLEVAREMLQKTDVPLEDVADRCGLGDARTLRRLFRERAGEAPSELRRRARA
jgi:transcriptional regulator GlxA family with amidase domain